MDRPEFFPATGSEQRPFAADGVRQTIVHRMPVELSPAARYPFEALTTRKILFHLMLLGLTILTTFAVGAIWFFDDEKGVLQAIVSGVIYSFTIIAILGAHEMGHYIACRWYGVNATLPYFIPVPLPPVGTFGAFIKIKAPIPSRRALFDIGIAGPLAGYVFALPAAFVGIWFAEAARPPEPGAEMIYFQDPLLFKAFMYLLGTPVNVQLNPVLWAAWVGVFMTSLNLLPVGQLDGGHVTYAVFGARGHRFIAFGSYIAVIGLAIYSMRSGMWNWVVYAAILTLMMRIGHPPVWDDRESLDPARMLVAVIGLLVFILSFMPFPISF
ncbi:MAG: site-2 protease family protein [Acidobacteriota bacterium]|nr:MAG: site-2 protease family protein [Acidobacteriota bacterium]